MPARTILLIGGTRGIGRAVTRELVEHGDSVAFTYRSDEQAAQQIERDSNGMARAWHLDHGVPGAAAEVVRAVEDAQGAIFGLVNCAGVLRESLLALTSDEDWASVIDTNLGGAFRVCRAVLRGMISNREGSIVNVSSLSAIHGVPGQAAYAASKSGLIGMTRSLAREMGRKNIRVNAVAPGFVATAMTRDLPESKIAALRANECLPSGVTPEHVAGTIRFLLSPAAAGITGQCIAIDAGASA